MTANGLMPRKDKRSWQLADFSPLAKAPPKWKAKINAAAGFLKSLFCGQPIPPESSGPPLPDDVPPAP